MQAGLPGAPVEVRKGPASTTWYNATLLDVEGNIVRVAFEDNIWPCREVTGDLVRRSPQETPAEDSFDPQVDEMVEVSINASETNPSGWSIGKVKSIKDSFYFVGFSSSGPSGGPAKDHIVEKTALRRCSREGPLDPSCLVRRLISVDKELHTWIRSQDSLGCLSHVQNKGRLLVAAVTTPNPDAPSKKKFTPEVVLLGDKHAVELGEKLLVHIHFKNQVEMQRFHDLREKLMARLSEQQKWYSSRHREVFEVDQMLVGRIIGKKGENIKAIRANHGVEVHLQDVDPSEGGLNNATITVTGDDPEACRMAREELEYISVKVPVEADKVGWILGKGHQTISEIAKKTELHYARYNDDTGALELCGLRHQVEEAKLLISVHRQYLSVYQDMDEMQNAIQQEFEELERDAPRRGGKKGGKGGKGDREYADAEGGKGKAKGGGGGDEKGDKGKGSKASKSERSSKGGKGDKEYPAAEGGKASSKGGGGEEGGGKGKGAKAGGKTAAGGKGGKGKSGNDADPEPVEAEPSGKSRGGRGAKGGGGGGGGGRKGEGK